MIENKKGLSTVVTTLIIILLVLVAIGIVWVVIKGVIDTGADQIEAKSACIGVELEIIGDPLCAAVDGECDVVVKRTPGGGTIAGLIVTADQGANNGRVESTTVLEELERTTIAVDITTATDGIVTAASTVALVSDGTATGTIACDLVTSWP